MIRTTIVAMYAALAVAAYSATAEAARCAKGKIYRPSIGVCQDGAIADRQGVRVKSRFYRPRVYRKALRPTPRPAIVRPRITYRDHVWKWVEANRSELIRTYER